MSSLSSSETERGSSRLSIESELAPDPPEHQHRSHVGLIISPREQSDQSPAKMQFPNGRPKFSNWRQLASSTWELVRAQDPKIPPVFVQQAEGQDSLSSSSQLEEVKLKLAPSGSTWGRLFSLCFCHQGWRLNPPPSSIRPRRLTRPTSPGRGRWVAGPTGLTGFQCFPVL